MNKLFKPKEFAKSFFSDFKEEAQLQRPLQVYSLGELSKSIMIPFPIVKTEYYSLIYLKNGIFKQQIGTQLIEVDKDTLIYISTGTIHSLREMDKQVEGYVIIIENSFISSLFNTEEMFYINAIPSSITLDKVATMWIEKVCDALHEEINQPNPNRRVAEGITQALLSKASELSGDSAEQSRTRQIVSNFKHLINQYCKEEKSVQFYANKLAISINYLNRCVQSIYAKSAKTMILEIIILHSQIMMRESSKDLSQICFDLNFEDVSYFSRLFKKVTGTTPSIYRKTIMPNLS